MNAEFYIIDDALFPEKDLSWADPPDPDAIALRIRSGGAPWGATRTSIEAFADTFEILEPHAKAPDFLRNMAFAGSPRLVLTEVPGPWRMGYFEASLSTALLGVIDEGFDKIAEEMAQKGEGATAVFDAFHLTLQEANARGRAVAILHS